MNDGAAPAHTWEPHPERAGEWVAVFAGGTVFPDDLQLDFRVGFLAQSDKEVAGVHVKGDLTVRGVFRKPLLREGQLDYAKAADLVRKGKAILLDPLITLREATRKFLGRRLQSPEKVKSLSLDFKDLFYFPEEIFAFENLEELALVHVGLPALPKEIGRLKKLRRLDVRGNGLRSLPDEIGELTALEYLGLQSNCIQRLPKTLRHCNALKEIDLVNNPYSYVKRAHGGWDKVELMFEFPEVLTELVALEKIDIRKTFIKNLPTKPFASTALQRINIEETLIAEARSPIHPNLSVNVASSQKRALDYIGYWLGRWEDAHHAVLHGQFDTAAIIYGLVVDINIPISAPYDKALARFAEEMGAMRKDTEKELMSPFIAALRKQLTKRNEKYPDNPLVSGLQRLCDELG